MSPLDQEVIMNHFTEAYIECALWSSNDESRDNGGDPLDANYTAADIAPETLAKMEAACRAFQKQCAVDLRRLSEEKAGHDFWLTRNGHGTGFWDRGYGELGDRLTEAAQAYGTVDLYIGDDGQIWA